MGNRRRKPRNVVVFFLYHWQKRMSLSIDLLYEGARLRATPGGEERGPELPRTLDLF